MARVAAAFLLLGGAAFWIGEVRSRAGAAAPTAPPIERLADLPANRAVELASEPAVSSRVELAAPAEAAAPAAGNAPPSAEPEPEAAPVPEATYRGRMVDLAGTPIEGMEIEWVQKGMRNVKVSGNMTQFEEFPRWLWRRLSLRTDREGAFTIDRYPASDKLNAEWTFRGPPRTTVAVGEDASGATVRVLAPAVRVAGVVRDAEMRPVPGATVSLLSGLDDVPSFPLALSALSVGHPSVQADEEGRFDLGQVPYHPNFRLTVRRDGQATQASTPVPMNDDELLLIQMPAAELSPLKVVFGTVRAADGSPLGGSVVYLGRRHTRADEDGGFRFETRGAYPREARILTRQRDHQFIALPAPSEEEALAPGGAGPIDIRFPARPLQVRGQVIDADGQPMEGVLVYVMNGTSPEGGGRMWETARRGHGADEPLATGPRGVFTVPQVLNRPYHLRFVDGSTLLTHDEETVDPSSGPIRVRLATDRLIEELEGTLVDAFGQPVQRAEIRLLAQTFVSPSGSTRSRVRDLATTDDRGRFTVRDLPPRGALLDVMPNDAPDGQPTSFALTEVLAQAPLRLTVDLQCRIEIVKSREGAVDSLEFLTDDGKRLLATSYGPGRRLMARRLTPDADGKFFPSSVSQRATQVVIFGGDREVGRQVIRLEPGEPNVIEL